jgi:Zn-dependent peptidase ImmA (M78 family)/transcriptional regulator with XRE-family HTH domain
MMTGSLFDSGFSGKRIRQLRELEGLTQIGLAELLGVTQGAIAQFEGAFKSPSQEFIQKLVKRFGKFEVPWFYRDPSVELETLLFRSKAATTRGEEAEARRYAEVVCEVAQSVMRHIKPISYRLAGLGPNPIDAARQVRTALHIPAKEPVNHVISEIEKSGVLVLALPKELEGRDGLAAWATALNIPVVALSKGRSGDRIRMSAAHEWGHIVLRHSKLLSSTEERQAFQFAGELLMPESAMRIEMTAPITLTLLAQLKRRWRVSMQALIRRGQDLKLLSDSQAADLYIQISAKWGRKAEPVIIPDERPRLVRQLVEQVYGQNWGTLADELGFSRQFMADILEGFEPKASPVNASTRAVATRKRTN